MVRVNHTLGTSLGAAGLASSSHLRNATGRARARDDVRRSQKGLMVASKLRSRFFHDATLRHPTVSIPTSELMNGLPVRVREVVEGIRPCCLPSSIGTRYDGDGYSESDIGNLHKHQLFSDDHAESLDPEIRQWLPRIVCPAFPFSTWCQGGERLGDAMLCHIETCEGYKTYFPREYRKQFSRSSNPKPPLKEVHHLLFQMTFGQLELLKSQFGEECEAGQRGLANISAETVEAVLHSWRPIVNPDVEEVLPSDFPPVRIPSFFGLIDHRSIELEYGMFMDGCDEDFGIVSLSSPAASESMEDVVELAYPELYLPPELLHPTSDPAYIAAAVAAHEPGVEQISPLIPIPFPSIMEEIPWDCIEGVSTPMNEYEWIFLSLRGEEK